MRAWRTSIARLNRSIELKRHSVYPLDTAPAGALGVSCIGTLMAADVTDAATGETYTLASMYGSWESPHTGTASDWIYADASVHRLVSDLSVFIGRQKRHRIIAAGDFNILYGHGEHGSSYWADR